MKLEEQITASLGVDKVDLVLKNANLINVLSGEVYKTDIAISKGIIVGITEGYRGRSEIDLEGKYVSPGFIDGHVHIESSMINPSEFAKAVIPRGTTTAIIDPHEIANVCGISGIEYMLKESEGLPINIYAMLPSCVPATPLETSGSELKAKDLEQLIDKEQVLGLGELMDVPAVLNKDEDMLKKIKLSRNKRIDGHAPGLSGKELSAYAAAGIKSEHECTTVEEARDRLRNGMYVMMREGSAAKNLLDLLPVINQFNQSQCLFVTDDRHPEDLIESGHIDDLIRKAISWGLEPLAAYQMATINTAKYFGLSHLGAIIPGCQADMVILSDMEKVDIEAVYYKGTKMTSTEIADIKSNKDTVQSVLNTVNLPDVSSQMFKVKANGSKVNVIELIPHQIVTKKSIESLNSKEGYFEVDTEKDIVKLAVVERHHATGNVGVGFVKGFGLQKGAIASTVSHDSHNLVIIGTNDEDMSLAAKAIADIGGGIVIAAEGKILDSLALPIAGLMSDQSLSVVKDKIHSLCAKASEFGVRPEYDPILTLGFLALPVIPELKITDKGLVDVQKFSFIPVSVE